MKILHICTFDTGGAGKAALRLHEILLKNKVESKFLCLHRKNYNEPEVFKFEKPSSSLFKKILNKIGLLKTQSSLNFKKIGNKKGRYEMFSFPNTDYALHEHPLLKEADIINLHWIANFLDYYSFFNKVEKPVVWTLHDANPFLGGFHLEEDINSNKFEFGELEILLRNYKEKILQFKSNIVVVTPSIWLCKKSQESISFRNRSHYIIPNGVNEFIFQRYNKELATQIWNGKKDTCKLLFVSKYLSSNNKGLHLLFEALDYLKSYNLEIWAIGETNDSLNCSNVKYLGTIDDDRLMALAYSAADAFIIPSKNENLPNVMLESLICGTPVISFKIGGIAEVIDDGFNGIFALDISAFHLAEAIKKFIANKNSFDSEEIRKHAIQKFSTRKQGSSYIDLYNSLLQNGTY
jgi:glycosyltransferase involved in cell wall biosynthesis